jgi:chromosome segregation ATPase
MTRIACFLLLASTTMPAQSSDSQTLLALLQELRQLRQDMYRMTLGAQRAQILLHRIQLQDDATKKTIQRYEQTNARFRDAERAHAEAVSGLKAAEEKLASLQNPNQRGELEALVQEMKQRVEMSSREESGYRAADVAAGGDLRTEQAKLSDLQQRLDRLEQQMEATLRPSP